MNIINIKKILVDTDFTKSYEYEQLGNNPSEKQVREKYQEYEKRSESALRESAYTSVFNVPETFQTILSLASENKPGELATYRLINRKWGRKTDAFVEHKWLTLKREISNDLCLFKTAIDQVEESNPNCLALEKCKKLSKKILLPVFIEKKLKNVPLTLKGYQDLHNEIQDMTLKIIWGKEIKPIFEKYFADQFDDQVPFEWQLVPAADASAEKIRTFLAQKQTGNALEQVRILNLSNLGLTIIPVELRLFINLQRLILNRNKIAKIENLGALQQLQCLDLSDNRIEEIQNLHPLQQLIYLDLCKNQIKKIKNLERLDLLFLLLHDNHIAKIENLSHLQQLLALLLGKNQILKIENLDALQQLERLGLGYNQITEIENLGNLQQLVILRLNNNLIAKIKNLDNQQNLQELELHHNRILKIENLGTLPCLRELSLFNNPIINIENINKLQYLEKFNGFSIVRQVQEVERKRKRDRN